MSKGPSAFCSASASSMAAADPPVTTQAERDRDSETHKFPIFGGDENNAVERGGEGGGKSDFTSFKSERRPEVGILRWGKPDTTHSHVNTLGVDLVSPTCHPYDTPIISYRQRRPRTALRSSIPLTRCDERRLAQASKSLLNKYFMMNDIIFDNNPDAILLTETRLGIDAPIVLTEASSPNFSCFWWVLFVFLVSSLQTILSYFIVLVLVSPAFPHGGAPHRTGSPWSTHGGAAPCMALPWVAGGALPWV